MQKLFPISVFFYQIHILQLENYDVRRFVDAVISKIFISDTEKEKDIHWTPKIIAVSLVSIIIFFIFVFFIISGELPNLALDIFVALFLSIALAPLFWIALSLVTILISPLDIIAKERIIYNARKKLQGLDRLKIIAITGSYGKTTMKEVLKTALGRRFRVVATQGSYNTPLGISKEILEKVDENTNIFIVEMGAYYRGDIKKLCSIAQPNISILTGINEAHLERFKDIETTIKAKFEIIEECSPDGKLILNANDPRIISEYKKYIGNQEVLFFNIQNNPLSHYLATNIGFDENGGGFFFTLSREQKEIGIIKTKFAGEYVIGNVITAFIVGGILGMTDAEIQASVSGMKPAEHRLNMQKTPNDMIVIDDSYNGNPEGVKEAIKTLARFKQRRKIYITPGLVEIGDSSNNIHREIGLELGPVADIVFLIENSTTTAIKEGLEESGFNNENLHIYKDKKDAYKELGKITRSGDVVLFQNDWPENYH